MIHKIINGYGKLLLSFVKILALVGLCAIFAFVLVLPLWKFATIAPDMYSTVIILLFAAGLVFFAGRSLKEFLNGGFPTPEERRKRIKQLLNRVGRIFVILIGLFGIITCILNESVVVLWIVLLLTIILYGVLAFGTKKEKK